MSELRIKLSLDVSAVPVHPVGAGRYTIELLHALIETGAVEIHLVARRGDAQRWEAMSDALQVHAVVPRSRPLRLCFEQLLLPRLLKQWGVDLHHGPHYTIPERATLPLVATIHDLTFFTRPKDHEAIKVRLNSPSRAEGCGAHLRQREHTGSPAGLFPRNGCKRRRPARC